MSEKLQQIINNEKTLSILNDPFSLNNITEVHVRFGQGILGDWKAYGSVIFVNGKTHGEQKFNGKTFDEVALQIKSFIEELKSQSK